MPEEHHLYSAHQAKTSPGKQTYRDAPFQARQTPREHQIAAQVSVAHGGAEQKQLSSKSHKPLLIMILFVANDADRFLSLQLR